MPERYAESLNEAAAVLEQRAEPAGAQGDARKALLRYGNHAEGCPAIDTHGDEFVVGSCPCGFRNALAGDYRAALAAQPPDEQRAEPQGARERQLLDALQACVQYGEDEEGRKWAAINPGGLDKALTALAALPPAPPESVPDALERLKQTPCACGCTSQFGCGISDCPSAPPCPQQPAP